MNHFTNRQVIVLCVLSMSLGALFSPPSRSVAQPPDIGSDQEPEPQLSETPAPLATPPASTGESSRSTRAIGTITGQGTVGSIAKFTGTNAIGNSVIFESSGKIGIGLTNPAGLLSVKSAAANLYPIYGLGVGNAILGSSSGGVGVYGIHSNTSGDQSGLLGESSSTSANAAGAVGTILSTAPGVNSAGVRGINRSTSANGFGVFGAQAGSGAGVYGTSPSGNALLGDSTNGTGVRGRHLGTTGTFPGVFGSTNSTDTRAVGVQGVVNSTNPGNLSAGVSGINNSTSTVGYGVYGSQAGGGYGVYGSSPKGTGVFGYTNDGNGVLGSSTAGNGVYGASSSGSGVFGSSSTKSGVQGFSANADGVYGNSTSGNGVYGYSVSGYAGYFKGNVMITGNLAKASGSFRIDHPQHPATEYLSHSFVESPDMMNVYNGNVTTNRKGEAVVTLPHYFQALNREFRYQLTPIGQFAQAIVGQEIKGNHFLVRTDKPHVKVSWQVTGIRNDAYARQHRIRVEETKARADQGKYLYPAGFGAGQDKQIGAPAPRLAAR